MKLFTFLLAGCVIILVLVSYFGNREIEKQIEEIRDREVGADSSFYLLATNDSLLLELHLRHEKRLLYLEGNAAHDQRRIKRWRSWENEWAELTGR